MDKDKVFILGDSGLIGNKCCDVFLSKNYTVYGFSKMPRYSKDKLDNFHHVALNLTKDLKEFFSFILEINPSIIVFATGNHEDTDNKAHAEEMFNLHFSFLNELVWFFNKNKVLKCNVLFCSSLMANLPDRSYPSYAASKAGLNHYIRSLSIDKNSSINISGLILGPVSQSPKLGFVSPEKVAIKIFNLSQKNAKGIYSYSFGIKLLSFTSMIFPFFIESILFNLKRNK
jgi:nucleoside-diphosphate-sugar epimerase